MVVDAKNDTTITQKSIDDYFKDTVAPKYKEANTKYEWSTDAKDTNIVKLVSNANGQFAIDGLAEGTYYLKETKAPDGYAMMKKEEKFEVNANSWASEGNIEFTKNKDGEDKIAAEGTSAMKVGNKNLTIPQTGGMGTVLFTIVGISLMAGAVVAMKRNREEA